LEVLKSNPKRVNMTTANTEFHQNEDSNELNEEQKVDKKQLWLPDKNTTVTTKVLAKHFDL